MGICNVMIDKEKDAHIQIKLPDCEMKIYNIGDGIALCDGCYLGRDGYFVVETQKIIYIGKNTKSYWE